MQYSIDVSDDYCQSFEADHDRAAQRFAEKVAMEHGPLIEVLVYRGGIVSGVKPFYVVRTDGRGNLR